MTTTVKIEAHCSPDKHVVVDVREGGDLKSVKILQSGQSHELVVYNNLSVTIQEAHKPEGDE